MLKELIAKKTIDHFSDFIIKSYKTKLEKRKLQKSIENFYTRLNNLRNTKTIWSGDKEIDISKIYVKPTVLYNNKRIRFNDLPSFPARGNLAIFGIAGEGKSTLMKMLCSSMLDFNEGVPIFVELRKIRPGESILDHAVKFIDIMGITVSKSVLESLLSEAKVVLFLDAFDEILEEVHDNIILEIQSLSQKYSELRILISSRPGTNIEYLQHFENIRIQHLTGNDYLAVVDKLCESDKEYKARLLEDIKASGFKAGDILLTPLMVSILIIVHQGLNKLPTTLPSYYELLFDVLLSRHDDIKITCRRKRLSKLDDEQLRKCFEALSYELHKTGYGLYPREIVHTAASKAMQLNGITCNTEALLKDYKNITSLLIDEGGKFNYLHNTIREYFAAAYIRSRPESLKQKFYNALLNKLEEGHKWAQVLEFLSEIDNFNYLSTYRKPLLDLLIPKDVDLSPNFKLDKTLLEKMSKYFPISIRLDKGKSKIQDLQILIALRYPLDKKYYSNLFRFANCEGFKLIAAKHLLNSPGSPFTWSDAIADPETNALITTDLRNLLIELESERSTISEMISRHKELIESRDEFEI